MEKIYVEKRRYPRLDTSADERWRIKVYGMKGRPLEGQIINVSLGGVAFLGHWRSVAKAVKRFTTRVEILMPNGIVISANSTLNRVRPTRKANECMCVLELTDIDNRDSTELQNFLTIH